MPTIPNAEYDQAEDKSADTSDTEVANDTPIRYAPPAGFVQKQRDPLSDDYISTEIRAAAGAPNISSRAKGDLSSAVDTLKRTALNRQDMDLVDSTARSRAENYRSLIDDWKKEIEYRQNLLEDPSISGKNVDQLMGNLAYAKNKLAEYENLYSAAINTGELPGFALERGLWHSTAGLTRDISKAAQTYAESLGMESMARELRALNNIIEDPQSGLPGTQPMAWKNAIGASGVMSYIGEGVGATAPWLAAMALGPTSVATLGVAAGQGAMREELERAGVTDEPTLRKAAYTYGTLIGGLQAVVPWAMLRGVTAEAEAAFHGTVGQIAAKIAARTSKITAAQVAAMELATWSQMYGISDTTGKPINWEEIVDASLEAGRQGLIGGATFGLAGEGMRLKAGAYKVVDPIKERQKRMAELATVRTPEAEAERSKLSQEVQGEQVAQAQTEGAEPVVVPEQPVALTPERRMEFADLLRDRAPRQQWAEMLDATPQEMEVLIQDAQNRGLVRVDRDGIVRRSSGLWESTDGPVKVPGEDGQMVKSEEAANRWDEMQSAVDKAVSGIKSDDIKVQVVDAINVSRSTKDELHAMRSEDYVSREVLNEQSYGIGTESGVEGARSSAGESASGGVTRSGEGREDSRLGVQPLRVEDTGPGKIVRQESASLRADGSVIAGRIKKARGQKASGETETIQRVGESQGFRGPNGYKGRVTAEEPTAGEKRAGIISSLTYKLTDGDGKVSASLTINQHTDGAWEVDSVDVRSDLQRSGIGTKLYNSIEKDLGIRMSPSGILSDAGLKFWKKRSPESVQWHQPANWPGYNFSPRKIWSEYQRLSADIDAMRKGTGAAARVPPEMREENIKALIHERSGIFKTWVKLPPEAKTRQSLDQMFALRGFYSPAIRATESLSMKKGTGEQFWKQITKTPGVKKDELDWMGVEEFLNDKKSITKDEVLAFMRAHQVELNEKVLGDDSVDGLINSEVITIYRNPDGTAEYSGRKYDNYDDAVQAATIMGKRAFDQHAIGELTKFSGHKIPGGENYRELLIRLPALEGKYESKHFEDQEIVHLRVDDRVGLNGEKILFVNEVQSDLHQDGRLFGYGSSGAKNAEEALSAVLRPNATEDQQKIAAKARLYINRYGKKGAPNAPFKNDFWLELALKRALLYATENNYDTISWARSDQIAKAVGTEPKNLELQYDQKIGRFFDKYTKRWGGKVEREKGVSGRVRLNDDTGLPELDMYRPGDLIGAIDTPEGINPNLLYRAADTARVDAIDEALRRAGAEIEKSPDVREIIDALPKEAREHLENVFASEQNNLNKNQVLRITPEMRASVMEGQPLSARADASILGQAKPDELMIYLAAKAIENEAAKTGRSPIAEAIRTARHEVFEMFKALGLVTESEWSALTKAAKRDGWVTKDIRKNWASESEGRTKEQFEDLLLKEAIMEKFADYETGAKRFTGVTRAIFERIKYFFTSLMHNIRRVGGFEKPEDIFHKYNTGEMKRRFEEASRGSGKGEELLSARAQPSPVELAMEDIRTELGLKKPTTPWKKGKDVGLRQQATQIAVDGGRNFYIAHSGSEEFQRFMVDSQGRIQEFALPLSDDPVGEGFRRFFREFILRPDRLRQSHPDLAVAFRDLVDAVSPHLLEGIDYVHTMQRSRMQALGAAAIIQAPNQPAVAAPVTAKAANFAAKSWRILFDGWTRNFQPELFSINSLMADPLFARYRSASAQEKDMIVARDERLWKYWNKLEDGVKLAFIRDFEIGAPQPTAELAEISWRYRALLEQAYRDEKIYGSKAGYLEDYFPHIWENPEEARKHFNSRTATLGPTWFQKMRHYELIQDGMRAGLKLKTTNPQELVTMRLLSGVDMRMRMELLDGLMKMGMASRAGNDPHTQNLIEAGWQAIRAPNMDQWVIAPDVQALWENAVKANGLWGNTTWIGSTFRGWMAFKNAWVPIKLTLSLFHPLHVAHISFSENMARAWGQLKRGDPVTAIKNAFANPLRQGVGYDARMAWLKPKEERTPHENVLVQLMTDGGFSPQLSEQLKINSGRRLSEAMQKNKWLKVAGLSVLKGIEAMQKPIFEEWIPGLKAGAYINDVQELLTRRPELMDNPVQRRIALRTIAKSIDNRFGEMFYSTLFWNRTVKDASIGSFLSLGWNLGFVREFIGGVTDPITRKFNPARTASEARQTQIDASNKMAFIVSYVTTAMIINGVMTAMLSGDSPRDMKDFIFPRIGGINPDGSPRRITNMFYTREVPMIAKHIEEKQSIIGGVSSMLWNKMMFQPFIEMAENKDYWGYEIYDSSAPEYEQLYQFAKHIFGTQLWPITMSGASRAAELSGSWYDKSVPLSFLGFGPAPAYVERSPLENRIRHLYKEFVSPLKKPYERQEVDEAKRIAKTKLLRALQSGDTEAIAEARQEARAAGASSQTLTSKRLKTPSGTYLFSRLPFELQRALLREASPEEMATYRKYANRKVKREFAPQTMTPQ